MIRGWSCGREERAVLGRARVRHRGRNDTGFNQSQNMKGSAVTKRLTDRLAGGHVRCVYEHIRDGRGGTHTELCVKL